MDSTPLTPHLRHDISLFVGARLADDVDFAHQSGQMLVELGASKLGVAPDKAEREARRSVYAAERKRELFEATVRPYLGTAGPTGLIADQQLRLLASMYSGHRDYRDEWRP